MLPEMLMNLPLRRLREALGGGTGQHIATVAGTRAGSSAGRAVQNGWASCGSGQHIIVKLNNGVAVGVTQPADPEFRMGDKVRIDGEGPNARVVRL